MQSDLRLRLTGISLLLPLVFAMSVGGYYALFALAFISILLSYELSRLLSKSHLEQALIGLFLLSPALVLMLAQYPTPSIGLMCVGLVVLIYLKGGIAGFYAISLALCFCSFTAFVKIPDFHIYLLAISLVIAAVDSGAYIVGRRIGGWKLAKNISPKKTVSGAVGGLVLGVLAGVFLAPFLSFKLFEAVIITTIISLVAQIGDLFESALKRSLDVKDSSALIPGHGGFLDRFDGYILVIPVITIVNLFVGRVS